MAVEKEGGDPKAKDWKAPEKAPKKYDEIKRIEDSIASMRKGYGGKKEDDPKISEFEKMLVRAKERKAQDDAWLEQSPELRAVGGLKAANEKLTKLREEMNKMSKILSISPHPDFIEAGVYERSDGQKRASERYDIMNTEVRRLEGIIKGQESYTFDEEKKKKTLEVQQEEDRGRELKKEWKELQKRRDDAKDKLDQAWFWQRRAIQEEIESIDTELENLRKRIEKEDKIRKERVDKAIYGK